MEIVLRTGEQCNTLGRHYRAAFVDAVGDEFQALVAAVAIGPIAHPSPQNPSLL